MTVGIVLLAMIALFVGLRLYAVLGQRTGHEQQPVTRPEAAPAAEAVPAKTGPAAAGTDPAGFAFEQGAAGGIRAIIAADGGFDVARFLEGAQAAYRMILEAFWSGDRATLARLASPDVCAAFEQAIADRETQGHTHDNRLVAIERATIDDARLNGRVAEIDVRFDAYVSAVTRNASGEMIAGSMTDAVPTNDVWTFRRTLRGDDPNWQLVDTDEAA
ncbi:Tim44/TimA family putative adaptor protein [Sphingosinicella ginsenosidimutans]|uniref:Tim44 domain-containing protein n=2 Tax=Allosphingosinicella ginsenosidimutans TaxID=1176539 RepID=A0A5C6TVC4_9SPHN|nr:Tim44/TimA family putative adaptor protein [Sphingosinicella ginsenosidimutans]TXC64352.1 Tim44 domain-containing protein [Sphingosinicella ginsenosidimutans]